MVIAARGAVCVQSIAKKFMKQRLVSRQLPRAVQRAGLWLPWSACLGPVLTKLCTFLEKPSAGLQLKGPGTPHSRWH